MLLEEDGGASGAASIFEGASPAPGGEGGADPNPGDGGADPGTQAPDPAQQQQSAPGTQDPTQQASGKIELTKEELIQLVRQQSGQPGQSGQPDPQGGQQKELSEEELDKLFNRAKITEDHVAAILGGGEGAVAAFNEVVRAIQKEAQTIAWYQNQLLIQKMQEQINPSLSVVEQQAREKAKESFFQKHEDLKGKDSILRLVMSDLQSKNAFEGLSQDQAFDLIAKTAREILGIQPGAQAPSPSSGGQGGQPAPQAKPPMAPVGGNRGGGAPPPSGGDSSSGPKSIFG
jgi:hypothetical protein